MFAIVILCLPIQSYAEDVQDPSSFMDMKSSIELLLSKVQRARKSIVTVVAYDSAGAMKSGSGVFIDTDGRIITNASILKNAYSAEVFSERAHYKQVVMLNKDENFDIALLQVNTTNEIPLELAYEYEISLGERVMVIGKSFSFKTTVSEGLISDIINAGETVLFEIETVRGLLTYKYSENGLVINMSGKVIGVVAKGISKYKDELFPLEYYGKKLHAISTGSIKPLVAGPYKIKQFQPPGTKVWPHWFKRELKESISTIFITLYQTGFKKIMAMVVNFFIIAVLLLWLLNKFKIIKLYK